MPTALYVLVNDPARDAQRLIAETFARYDLSGYVERWRANGGGDDLEAHAELVDQVWAEAFVDWQRGWVDRDTEQGRAFESREEATEARSDDLPYRMKITRGQAGAALLEEIALAAAHAPLP